MLAALRRGLADLGGGATAKIRRLGFAARFFVAILLHSGTALRRFGLTIREIYFAGVLSMVIILVSGLFVGMVLVEVLKPCRAMARARLSVSWLVLPDARLGPVIAGLLFASRAGSAITLNRL